MMDNVTQYLTNNTTSPTINISTNISQLLLLTNDTSFAHDITCTAKTIHRVQATLFVAFKGLLMVAIMSTAIFGNLLVIISVLRFERLRLIANTFIVSLAFTDLLVACFVMPFSASKELANGWWYGQVACDIFNANDVLFSTASLLNLCCISLDRYVAVTDPLRYEERLTRRRVAGMLVAVWVTSAAISHIPIHTWAYTTEEQKCIMEQGESYQCTFEVNQTYGIISSTISFWIPAIIMLVTYHTIYHEATKQEKQIQSMTALSSRETSTDRLQYQCVDEAVLRTPPRGDPYHTRRIEKYRSLGPSLERNLGDSRNLGRNTELKLDFTCPNRNNIRRSLAGSLDRILERNLNRNVERTSCDVHVDTNPDGSSFDRQLNRKNLNRSLDGGLDRNLNQSSLDRISFDDRKLCRDLIRTSYDRHLDRNVCQNRRKMRREHKAARTLGIIMGAFLFCWLPFFTWYLTNALCGEACQTPHAVESTLFWIGYLNSAINPIIYALFNRDFRDAFRRLLSFGVRQRSQGVMAADCRKTVTASQDRISMR